MFFCVIKISYISIMYCHIYLLKQIHCVTAGFIQVIHDLLNIIQVIKSTENKGYLLNNYIL